MPNDMCAHILCNEIDMKNITLSMDERTLKAGREYAKMHGLSFNDLVRKLVEQTVLPSGSHWLDDVFTLMDNTEASSQGRSWTREELYRA